MVSHVSWFAQALSYGGIVIASAINENPSFWAGR